MQSDELLVLDMEEEEEDGLNLEAVVRAAQSTNAMKQSTSASTDSGSPLDYPFGPWGPLWFGVER